MRISTDQQARLEVFAPERIVESVIGNLLRNAVAYTDEGGVSVRVTSDAVVNEDTGPGMSPEMIEKAFKPHVRQQRRRGGFGVGLTIVKRLTDTERPEAIVAWMVILQSPLSLIPAAFVWTWPSPITWVWLFCLAGAGTIGHVCWTRAVQLAEVSQLQPLEFTKLPLVALLGFLIFAEIPTVWTWFGGAVIFASTFYISYREAKLARGRAKAV